MTSRFLRIFIWQEFRHFWREYQKKVWKQVYSVEDRGLTSKIYGKRRNIIIFDLLHECIRPSQIYFHYIKIPSVIVKLAKRSTFV